MGYSPWGHNESDMTDPLSVRVRACTHTHTHTHTHADWDQDVSTTGSFKGKRVDQSGEIYRLWS